MKTQQDWISWLILNVHQLNMSITNTAGCAVSLNQLLSDVRTLQAEVKATRKWVDRGGLEAQDKMDEQRAATNKSGAMTRWRESK